MSYKKDVLFIIGKIIMLCAIAVMAVTFVLMGFGRDNVIVWFFGACPFLIIGMWIMQGVKRRYMESDALDGSPVPMFNSIRIRYSNFKDKVRTDGALKVFYRLFLWVVSICVVICFLVCGDYYYRRAGQFKDPKYTSGKEKYAASQLEYKAALERNDTEKVQEFLEDMDYYRKQYEHFETLEEEFAQKGELWLKISVSAMLFDALAFAGFAVICYKHRTEKTAVEGKE